MNDIIDYDVLMPDHLAKMQRLQVVVDDPMTMEIVIQRVLDGESLKAIARSWKLPTTRFIKWISEDEKRLAEYEGALRIRADELVYEAVERAEGIVGPDGELSEVARDKLVIDTNLKVAAFWDKTRYGNEKAVGGAGITIVINRGGEALSPELVDGVTIDEN
jgi:CBS domain-containing protein